MRRLRGVPPFEVHTESLTGAARDLWDVAIVRTQLARHLPTPAPEGSATVPGESVDPETLGPETVEPEFVEPEILP
jgi:hypothetical protein